MILIPNPEPGNVGPKSRHITKAGHDDSDNSKLLMIGAEEHHHNIIFVDRNIRHRNETRTVNKAETPGRGLEVQREQA